MMVAIFVTMTLGLAAARWAPRWVAVACVVACLALSTILFLYEIDSPEYGFRMPWLQTLLRPVASPRA